MNVVLLVQAIVKEDAIASFRNEVLSTAEAALKEPFCISIDLSQDPNQPSHFTLYEVWASKDYLLSEAHQKAPHILSFFKNTESMLAQPFQHSILDVVSKQQGTDKDRQQIRQLTQQWINLWSPKDKPFTGEGFEQIFATDENEILVFDNFDDSVVVLHSLQSYLSTWVPVMQQFAYWEIAIEDNLEISVNGDLAVTTFSFVGGGQNKDGQNYKLRQYGTHAWKRMSNRWRLVHEHLTVGNSSDL
jgi:quinol monooxygenase YgiN/ketosteroid isomerase-like protein